MAQSANGSATAHDLEKQIEALKTDISGITRILGEMAAERREATVDGVQQAASDLHARGADAAAEMRRKGQALGDQAADAVRQQPATAMAIAVGAGFLVGLLTGRR